MSTIRFQGPYQRMGPVKADSTATLTRNDVVTVTSGQVTAISAGTSANLAVCLQDFPDNEYEGTQSNVELARLGEYVEVEVYFVNSGGTNTLAQADIGGGPFALQADGDIDLDTTASGVFTPLRVSRDTAIGDASGYLVGVFTDASSFGS